MRLLALLVVVLFAMPLQANDRIRIEVPVPVVEVIRIVLLHMEETLSAPGVHAMRQRCLILRRSMG